MKCIYIIHLTIYLGISIYLSMFTVQVVDRKADHDSELLKSKQRCEEIEAQLEDNSKKARSGFRNITQIIYF